MEILNITGKKVDLDELRTIAISLANYITNKSQIVAIYGELGAGKTTFCSSVIKHLILKDELVVSPTFTFLQTYQYPYGVIYHYDLYRIKDYDKDRYKIDILEIGFYEALINSICLVEWPEIIEEFLPNNTIKIYLDYVDESNRYISIKRCN